MATGTIHAATDDFVANNLILAGIISTPVLGAWALGIVVAGVIGRFVGPDLDVHHLTTEQERRVYRLNWWLGLAWEIFWLPYAFANTHRGRSHTWQGTLERFCYLYWLPLLAWSEIAETYPAWAGAIMLFWLMVLLGHGLLDRAHVRLDKMRYF